MKKIKYTGAWVLGLALLIATGCSDTTSGTATKGNYFVAATQGDFTYMLAVDDLESGTASIVGNAGAIEEPYAFTLSLIHI